MLSMAKPSGENFSPEDSFAFENSADQCKSKHLMFPRTCKKYAIWTALCVGNYSGHFPSTVKTDSLGFRTASEFTKLYYESVDRKRHLMSRYYMDTASLVWNGNGRNGADDIQKFLASLPTSIHTLMSLDVQRIPDGAVGNKMAFVIQTSGTVKFQGMSSKPFYQTVAITNEGDKWKIVSDSFRFQEPVS